MIIGHIGARAGSKGVPGKNFRDMCGKPLMDWSLDQLLNSARVDAVVFSTDSPEMYEHAVSKGALEIGLRPAQLATDDAPKWGVWQHALDAAEAIDEQGGLQVSKPLPGGVWARQNAPVVYDHVGLVYVLDPAYLRTAKTIYEGKVVPYVIPAERCLDVDNPIDWKIVEFLMKDRLGLA